MKRVDLTIARITVLMIVSSAAAQPFTADQIADTLRQFRTCDYASDPAPAQTIENMIRFTLDKPQLRAVLEEHMIALLESDAVFRAKQFVCEQLAVIGTDTSLPTLGKMLLNKDTAELACFALRTHPSQSAGAILRSALSRVDDQTGIRIINILGNRHDADAVDQLIPLLRTADPAVAEAAAISLGDIGADKAAAAIARARAAASGPMRTALTRAWLRCAEQFTRNNRPQDALAIYKILFDPSEPLLVRRGALVGALNTRDPAAFSLFDAALKQDLPVLRAAAIANSRLLSDRRVTTALIVAFNAADTETQVIIVEALALRRDLFANETMTSAAQSPHTSVRIAAFNALAAAGDASSAKTLCNALLEAATPAETDTILAALRRMQGPDVDPAILDRLRAADNPRKIQLIGLIADRRYRPASPVLLNYARRSDALPALLMGQADTGETGLMMRPRVGVAALKALASLASADDLPALLDILTASKEESVRDEAVRTIIAIAHTAPDTAPAIELCAKRLDASPPLPAQIALLRALAALPSEGSLARLRLAVNSPDPQLHDAAVRALAQYPAADAAPILLDLFKAAADPAHRTLALRGLTRLCTTAGIPAPQAVSLYTAGLAAASTPAERILILSGLAQTAHPDALKLVTPLLEDQTVKTEAALALLTIAENTPGLPRESVTAAAGRILADDTLKHLAPRASKLAAQQ
jgi:HEAT repeat protein